ncbi:hypothetical protein [Williamsia sp. CHRR-6]|uniref:hypothetical protein n=1 Tax=Williamsia sp. CHRR-6 TaxID=2835871 RepID=UPI001BDA2DB0|nr:hypothetical protein [Williamsia sp. CHRR-6]MBT0568491.1 hypothetical protein [Williamsia sp. CHRR-6]
MTDAETRSQVLEPAIDAVRGNNLKLKSAMLYYESGTDDGHGPFAGDLVLIFEQPIDPMAYRAQIMAQMTTDGWVAGARPDQHYHNKYIMNKGNLVAHFDTYVVNDNSAYQGCGRIEILGEYRNPKPQDGLPEDVLTEIKRRAGFSTDPLDDPYNCKSN